MTLLPGDRIGAMSRDRIAPYAIGLFGYGVYEGDFPHDGHDANPRFRLDDGSVVYGTECWWGTEDTIRMICAHAPRVETVDVGTEMRDHYA